MKKIVVIGGGTGVATLLRGLKEEKVDLTAVVSMADSGGSTGRLRDEFGVLPPGDLRNCLVALANDPVQEWIHRFRFDDGNLEYSEVGKHNLGNLILTALTHRYHGDFMKAVRADQKILRIHPDNRVLPVTLANIQLKITYEDGTEVIGEANIDKPEIERVIPIKSVSLFPQAFIYREASRVIREADLIIVGPGSLYTSIISALLTKDPDADEGYFLRESQGKLAMVVNVMTKRGQSSGKRGGRWQAGEYIYKAGDFVGDVEQYAGRKFHHIICNTTRPSQELCSRYNAEGSYFVETDVNDKRINGRVILEDLVSQNEFYRHDPNKLASVVMGLL